MNNKIAAIVILLMILLLANGNEANAAVISACPRCGGAISKTYKYENGSKHTATFNCNNCGINGGDAGSEGHYSTSGWKSEGNGTNKRHYKVCMSCNGKYNYAYHSYGDAQKSNETQHRVDCTVCSSYMLSNHETTRSATCTAAAYCGTCSSTFGSALGHSWGEYESNGASGHRRKCTVCNTYEATKEHSYMSLSPSINDNSVHSIMCSVCNYEKDIEPHTMKVYDSGQRTNGSYYHNLECVVCNKYSQVNLDCSFTSQITKDASCTANGIRKYTCTVCAQSYTEAITKIAHVWSNWQTSKTEHWKVCNYGCGTENSRGSHVDANPIDGKCDTCNYVMYIAPIASISSNVTVKEGATATFSVTTSQGTQPLTYQWYYKTSSSGTGTAISGATSAIYTVTTTKSMNGRYYYCTVSNPAGSSTTSSALLTVYYTFTIGTQPQSVNLKKGETATFSVGIGTTGNPNAYTYQWYVANSATGTGSKITNATSSSYSVTPTKNIHEEYYYCVVSSEQYTVTSNRAKLAADITEPAITMGTFNQNMIINNSATLKIPFIVSDTGEGYTENNSNFTASDITVKIDGVANSTLTKTLTYTGASGNDYHYELTITNVNGNGKLSFEIPAGAFEDNFHNTNVAKSFSTNVIIDNIAPAIKFDSVTGTTNGKYINSEGKLVIKILIKEEIGMNTDEFTADDIIVKVGGNQAGSYIEKTLKFVVKSGNNYIYELILGNIQGDGELSLEIPASRVKDMADNQNVSTTLSIKVGTEDVIVDNTKPVITSLVTTLGGYDSSRDYPSSLKAKHNNWANENIYVQINATDTQEIDYYMRSVGDNTKYTKLTSNQEVLSNSLEATVYYKVVDKAGNYSEVSKVIKLDKITPNKPVMSLFEQRQNGAAYIFNANKPTDKSIYVIPNASTIVDAGSVQSGIEKNVNDTYYTITKYEDKTKTVQVGTPKTRQWNEGVLLNESGYYEIMIVMTDIAGNSILGDMYKVYIDKKAENTIRISNITDVGSGIRRVTIRVYKADSVGNKTSEQVIEPIVVENPYKEIIKNVRLGDGKFYVEITLEDKVGLETVLKKVITNVL